MKTKIIFTTALASAFVLASATPSLFALAQTSVYPESFDTELTFVNLCDFAIDGEKFAFADGNYVYVYNNGELEKPSHELSYAIVNVEFVQGELVFGDSSNKKYTYSNGEITEYEQAYEFENVTSITIGEDYHYYFNDSGLNVVDYHNSQTPIVNLGADYTKIKCYNNEVYAIKNSELFKIAGTSASKMSFIYDDYSSANSILRQGFDGLFKTEQSVSLKKIAGGSYITEVDLEQTEGEYFAATQTLTAKEGTLALLVATYGNASIVAFEGKTYITLNKNLSDVEFSPLKADKQFGNLNLTAGVYSTPFMCESTKIATLNSGTPVKIIDYYVSDVLLTEFYLVEYGTEGAQGYVAKPFVTPNDFSAEQNGFGEITGETSYENEIKTVIIVLIIVLLVFLVIIYVFAVGTSSKNKRKPSSDEDDILIVK